MVVIDNATYGIYNDGTHPTATTDGINRALIELSGNGLTQVGLSPGTYLISADGYISIPRWTTLDLNGAVIKKEPNSNEAYKIIYMTNDHSEIRNGTIHGDKNEHDYSNGATHEGGYGVLVSGARFTRLENLEIKDCTGDGVAVGNDGFAYCAPGMSYFSDPCLGRFSRTSGWNNGCSVIEEAQEGWVCFPKHRLDITLKRLNTNESLLHSRFQVGGNGYDKQAFDIEHYIMTFYDGNGAYLGYSAPVMMSDDVYVEDLVAQYPTLRYICFSFKVPYSSAKSLIDSWNKNSIAPTLRTTQMADHTEIQGCHIHHCRRQGITGGGKFLHVIDCHIHDIGGTAPSFGIDIEDGYSFNSMARIEGCRIERNAGGCIVICSTRDVVIRDCQLRGLVKDGKGNGTGVCFYSKDNIKNLIDHCQFVGLYNAIDNGVVRDSIFIDCSIGGKLIDCTLIDCRLQATDSMRLDLTRCKLIRTGTCTQKINGISVKDCELTDCGIPNAYLFPQEGCDIVFENNHSINNARWHEGRENAWPLICFTTSGTNKPVRSLRFVNNSYEFNNEDTVRGLFCGLTIQSNGVVEIRNNELSANGCIMNIGSLTSQGNVLFDIQNNHFTTSYSSYLNSYYGINLTGSDGDYLLLDSNYIQLKKNRKPTMTITGIPAARITNNTFDAELAFSCDDAYVYAERNTAPAINFGTAIMAHSGSASTVDIASVNTAIEELRVQLNDKNKLLGALLDEKEELKQSVAIVKTALSDGLTVLHDEINAKNSQIECLVVENASLKNSIDDIRAVVQGAFGGVVVENQKYKETLSKVVAIINGTDASSDSN